MVETVSLYRPLTRELLHPEIEYFGGDDTQTLSGAGDITFTVDPSWETAVAADGEKVFAKRKTFVIVEASNGKIRQAGLVDSIEPTSDGTALEVSCAGHSVIAGQSGPWEGHQGYYVTKDPVSLFRDIWKQVQSYKNSDLGISITGDKSSGSSVGDLGSSRYQKARRDYLRYQPELEKWESRVTARERILFERQEKMFRAAGLKRVGDVTVNNNEPDDPGYKANSTLWVHASNRRAHRWRNGRWVSQSQSDRQTDSWLKYRGTLERAKDEVERLKYLAEPAKELMEEYEEREGREEYSLYFWQNHDIGQTIEDLTEMGPFEFREEAQWSGDNYKLSIRVGAPSVGAKRPELHLELGHNILDIPPFEDGELFTGVAVFGAGEGSAVLSQQRSWNPKHAVRNIFTDTDKDAYTKSLTQTAANKALKQIKKDAGLEISEVTVRYGRSCREGSFSVGDRIFVTGVLSSGRRIDSWVKVISITTEWGTPQARLEVEEV